MSGLFHPCYDCCDLADTVFLSINWAWIGSGQAALAPSPLWGSGALVDYGPGSGPGIIYPPNEGGSAFGAWSNAQPAWTIVPAASPANEFNFGLGSGGFTYTSAPMKPGSYGPGTLQGPALGTCSGFTISIGGTEIVTYDDTHGWVNVFGTGVTISSNTYIGPYWTANLSFSSITVLAGLYGFEVVIVASGLTTPDSLYGSGATLFSWHWDSTP